MQQHQRLLVQETVQPGGHIHGRRAQRKIAVELTHDFSAFQQLLVQQQTASHAAQQCRCGIPHGQAAQCQAPGIHRLLRLAVAGAQPQGLVRRQHLGLHGSRSILIHGHAGNRQTDGGAQHQRIDHASQQRRIRLAHTAIAIDIGQRRQGLQQLGHIANEESSWHKGALKFAEEVKTLSKGSKEKVQLILAMSRQAKLYLLDEPIGGVDPATRDYIIHTILTNYSRDASVIISTHLIEDVEPVLDEAVFLKNGKIFAHRSVDELRETEGMSVDAYFREVFKC